MQSALRAPVRSDRRLFLKQSGGLAAGVAGSAVLSLAERRRATDLLRPPGVVDESRFVERCLRCLQCVRSCPNQIIKITGPDRGFASLFTPHIEFGQYGCDYFCQVCQTVCPNFAIPLQSLQEKQKTPIGKATIDENHCVVFAKDTNCLVCEEVCPVPGKAISIREQTVVRESGPILLRYPVMEPTRCIGCGICQVGCPSTPIAITVHADR